MTVTRIVLFSNRNSFRVVILNMTPSLCVESTVTTFLWFARIVMLAQTSYSIVAQFLSPLVLCGNAIWVRAQCHHIAIVI